jgi:hypothetical protein
VGRTTGPQESSPAHTVEIVQNLVVPEAKHALAALCQFDAAALIGLLAKRMLPAIRDA